jgi:phosphoglycerate dehydrogenase-like enzyme
MPDTVVVTFKLRAPERAVIAEALGTAAEPIYLTDLEPAARASALTNAKALLARHTGHELRPGEAAQLTAARLVQFMSAGIDFIPMHDIPATVPIAGNGGAYSEPMAEHGLAMALAAAKKLIVQHAALAQGEFNQMAPNRVLSGGTCGIIGFGGIGEASARLFRALGMRIHAINRRGAAAEPTDWIGTMADLDTLLAVSDVIILSMPLTPATKGMIGPRELQRMKPDAILVNLARGEVIEEAALFDHLKTHPDFHACLDAWWVEPLRHGEFRMDYPFMTLPNVVGSPHNSASVPGMTETGLRRAVANIRRALAGEAPHYVLAEHERMI